MILVNRNKYFRVGAGPTKPKKKLTVWSQPVQDPDSTCLDSEKLIPCQKLKVMAKNNPNKLEQSQKLAILSKTTANLIYVGQARLFHPRLAVGLTHPSASPSYTVFIFILSKLRNLVGKLVIYRQKRPFPTKK